MKYLNDDTTLSEFFFYYYTSLILYPKNGLSFHKMAISLPRNLRYINGILKSPKQKCQFYLSSF